MTLRTDNPLAYVSWCAMRRRCLNSDDAAWPSYGGRGITIDARWMAFEAFLADMGERLSQKHSLERLNVNGNYAPGNCIWALKSEQAANRRPADRPNPTGFNLVDRGYLLHQGYPRESEYVTIIATSELDRHGC